MLINNYRTIIAIIAKCSWMAEYIVQLEEINYKNNDI